MNNKRRQAIGKIKSQLEDLFNKLEEIAGDERDAFDVMHGGLQESERGQKSEEAAGLLENAACDLQSVIDSLEEATS